jgi:uncharacterized membrane-anchored protein
VTNLVLAGLLALAAAPPSPPAELPRIAWTVGPATMDLGVEAQIRLSPALAFAGPDDTRQMMRAMGNRISGLELGLVSPRAEGDDWVLVFEYHDLGHVQDDEKNRIDPDALLAQLRLLAVQDDQHRLGLGLPPLRITGWYEAPHYDERSHHLIWAPQAKTDDGRAVVNYNLRLLGREGFMAVTLIDDPARLAVSKPAALAALEAFSFKPGRAYADYRPGDRLAGQGLLGLLTGAVARDRRHLLPLLAGGVALAALLALAWWRRASRATPGGPAPKPGRQGRRS